MYLLEMWRFPSLEKSIESDHLMTFRGDAVDTKVLVAVDCKNSQRGRDARCRCPFFCSGCVSNLENCGFGRCRILD